MLSRLRPRLTFALAENQSFRGTLMTMGTVSDVSTGALHTKRCGPPAARAAQATIAILSAVALGG
jgi:hypothetical protein